MKQNVLVTVASLASPSDSKDFRKARGAFFTPDAIARFMTEWAVRSSDDRVLEPSAGDAAFLVAAVRRLQELGNDLPEVSGVEIHAHSVRVASERVTAAGGLSNVIHSDFFLIDPEPRYTAVIGNPPYIRYQDFAGESRTRSRAAALKAGVSLNGLASSWAAFTVQSALFLEKGGRLALVLPAELLSVNYAGPVRQFLFDRFKEVNLVLFSEQIFPDAEADVVLLLAEGYGEGPAQHAKIQQAKDAQALTTLGAPLSWTPQKPADKWTGLLTSADALRPLEWLREAGAFGDLNDWGDTTLGMVTGNNSFFALSPARVKELGIPRRDILPLSPPGSTHLRGLSLSSHDVRRLGAEGKSTWLFRPGENPSRAAQAYIAAGRTAGVDQAYKCRVRKSWYQVPLLPPADLLLTCMNADTPRLTSNEAKAHHLNSVHGVYLSEEAKEVGRELLPIASLNSVTLLSAEMVGRSYGGGILKLEPREADSWAMPSLALVKQRAGELGAKKQIVACLLRDGKLFDAVRLIDATLFEDVSVVDERILEPVREAHRAMMTRRLTRGESGR